MVELAFQGPEMVVMVVVVVVVVVVMVVVMVSLEVVEQGE